MSDRGMKKWAPYKSLNEQWETLDALHEKEERVELDLPLVGGGTEPVVRSPHGGNCLIQRRNI